MIIPGTAAAQKYIDTHPLSLLTENLARAKATQDVHSICRAEEFLAGYRYAERTVATAQEGPR